MKKLFSLKKILLISLVASLVGITSTIFATDVDILAENNSTTLSSSSNNTQTIEDLGSTPVNTSGTINSSSSSSTTNSSTNNVSTGTTTNSAYNTVDNDDSEDDLPQTGIEDYNIGILLVICVGASIYTYKKMRDYRNV